MISKLGLKSMDMIPFKTSNGHYGYINSLGKVVIEPIFTYASEFDLDGLAAVTDDLENNFLIDTNQNVRCVLGNLHAKKYKEGYRIVEKWNWSLFRGEINITYGLLKYNRFGLLKEKKLMLKPKYQDIDYLGNEWCIAKTSKGYDVFNFNYNLKLSYTDGVKFEIDADNDIIKFKTTDDTIYYLKYDAESKKMKDIHFYCHISDYEIDEKYKNHPILGLCVAVQKLSLTLNGFEYKHSCVCDKNGDELFKPDLSTLRDKNQSHYHLSSTDKEFFNLIYTIKSNKKYGLIDASGKVVLPPIFNEEITITPNRLITKINDKYHVYDYNGKLIFKIQCDYLKIDDRYPTIFIVGKDGKEYYLDCGGNLLFDFKYDKCNFPVDNLFVVESTSYDYSMNDPVSYKKYCILNDKGMPIFSFPNDISDEINEFIQVKNEDDTIFIGKKDDEIIFIDITGNVINRVKGVIKELYDDCIIVENNNYFGLYNIYGDVIVPCESLNISKVSSYLFDVLYQDKHFLIKTKALVYYCGPIELNSFDYFYNHNPKENLVNMINSKSKTVLINYNFGNEVGYYSFVRKEFLKVKVSTDEMLYQKSETNYRIKDIYARILKYLDLRGIDFSNVKGLDFTGTNALIDIDNNDLSDTCLSYERIANDEEDSFIGLANNEGKILVKSFK